MYTITYTIKNGVFVSNTELHTSFALAERNAIGFVSREYTNPANNEFRTTIKWNTIQDWYNFTKENAILFIDTMYDRYKNPGISNSTLIIVQQKHE